MIPKQLAVLSFELGLCVFAESSVPTQTPTFVPGWTFTNLSRLLPDQPTFPAHRQDRGACAARQGVFWLADYLVVTGSRGVASSPSPAGPSTQWSDLPGSVIAFWDRKGVSYLTPNRPYPPDWTWRGVREPSACGADVTFPLQAIWPPDAGPFDPHYFYTEMFLLDDQGLHRITWDHASWHLLPSLHEGGIAWQTLSAEDPSADDWEIRYWDGYGIRPITDNDVDDTDPSLYGGIIAWCSGGTIVYLSVPPSGDPSPLPPPVIVGPGESPCLFEHKIAYCASDGHDMEIFLHDIPCGQTLQITDNEDHDTNPSLYDGTIAWQSAATEQENANIFYWDGKTVHQVTDDSWYNHIGPSLWGTGLNTTIAYGKSGLGTIPGSRYVMCARRTVLSVVVGPLPGQTIITWPSLEGRAYRVEYTDDLITWTVAAESVASAGYGETSWTDGEASGTTPPPSEVPQRWYRVCEHEQSL